MLRKLLITLLIMAVWAGPACSKQDKEDPVMKATKKYIETLEWDSNFNSKIKEFAAFKDVYTKKLSSQSPEDIFLSAIMLGLLNDSEATSKLKAIKIDSVKAKIGISFALCMLKEECQAHRNYLMQIGEITEMAGRARSLKYLEAVELLSLMRDANFLAYASKIRKKTDEVWQQEAIGVAIERHRRIINR